MEIARGDVVIVVATGDFGKPRPAVVVQSDLLNRRHETISVCLLTSDIEPSKAFRIIVEATPENGLQLRSQIMADKIMSLTRLRVRKVVGRLSPSSLDALDSTLRWTLGLT